MLKKIFKIIPFSRQLNTSALYVPRDKATSINSFLMPCLDCDFDKLRNSIQLRNLNINIDEIIKLWNFYKQMEETKLELEAKRHNIVEILKNLNKTTPECTEKIDNLKTHGKFLREELKTVKEKLGILESDTVLHILNLPNILDAKVPNLDQIKSTFLEKPNGKYFHLQVGTDLNLIEYHSPQYYFLKNEAALLELKLMDFCSKYFSNHNFVLFSNPDFARSIVLDGCKRLGEPVVELDDKENDSGVNKLNLIGGSSAVAFMAFYTKNLIHSPLLPLKHYHIGRSYTRVTDNLNLGLFQVGQSTRFDIFLATTNWEEEYEKEFQNTLDLVVNLYKTLGYHFQIKYRSAINLNSWESFRADIELYSTSLQKYVTVGYLALIDSYYSKRLQFQYLEQKEKLYPKIIEGCVIDFPKLLGCILEQNSYEYSSQIIPNFVKIV